MNIDLVNHPLFFDPNSGSAWVLGLLGKSVLIVAAGLLADAGLRKSSAATRHGLWVTVFVLLGTLFVSSLAIPFQRVEVTPTFEVAMPDKASRSKLAPVENPRVAAGNDVGDEKAGPVIPPDPSRGGEPLAAVSGDESRLPAPAEFERKPIHWEPWVISIWLLGLVCGGLWTLFIYGLASLRFGFGRLSGEGEDWSCWLREGQERFGIRRRCEIRFHEKCQVPMTLGLFFPKIILPEQARRWGGERRQAVLWHELAHVRRLDFGTQFLGRIVTAIFWPNVLCWFALRRMHSTREQACDDAVVRELCDPEGYAMELVETVRGIKREAFGGAGVGIASSGNLKGRVAAILDRARNRQRMSRWVYVSGLGCAVLSLFLGLIWVTPQAAEPASQLSEPERAQVEKMLEAIDRNVEEFSHGTFEGEQNTCHWEEGAWDEPPMPARFRAWVGGTSEEPKYRIDFTPSVFPWTSGAAPYFIENATQFSDGKSVFEMSHDHLDERKLRASPIEEFDALPGINALLHVTGGSSTVTSPHRHQFPPRNILEYYLRIASGRERYRVPDEVLKFEVGEELLENIAVFRFEVVINGRERERWWMDPARGYALLGRDHAFTAEGQPEWKTVYRIRVSKLIEAGEGFWFPGEVQMEGFRLTKTEPTFKRASRFQKARFGQKIPDGFFSRENITAAIRQMQFGEDSGHLVQMDKASSSLELILIDGSTEKPLPEVEVEVKRDGDSFAVTTNAEGRCKVSLGEKPAEIDYLSVSARPDGFAPTKLSWRRYGDPLSFPSEYRVTMERGTAIGGSVVDVNGNPLSGATVSLRFPIPQPIGSQSDSRLMRSAEVKTDEAGNWRYPLAPKNLNGMSIGAEHPDFAADLYLGSFRNKTLQPYETLFDFSAKLVLEGGRKISGRILDHSGEPVAEALVKIGRDRWGANYPDAWSNEEGHYEFLNVKPEREIYLTVESEGHAPALSQHREPDLKKVLVSDFKLDPASVLSVRIVDEAGNPAEGVSAVADTWRETRSLDFNVKTGQDGRFEWKNAPPDTVLFDLLSREVTLRNVPLKAGETEQVVVLRPAIRIRGTAVDAVTEKAIPEFRVVLGRKTEDTDRDIYWREDSTITFSDGKFERTGSNLGWLYYFRAEAEGYEPQVIGPFRGEAKDVNEDFQLKPSG